MEFNLALKSNVLYEQDVSYHLHLVTKSLLEAISENEYGLVLFTPLDEYTGNLDNLPTESLRNKNKKSLTKEGYKINQELVIGFNNQKPILLRMWSKLKEDVTYIKQRVRGIVDYKYEVLYLTDHLYDEFNLAQMVIDMNESYENSIHSSIVDLPELIYDSAKELKSNTTIYKIKKVSTSESPNNPYILTHWLNFNSANSRKLAIGIQVLYRKVDTTVVIGVIYKYNDEFVLRATGESLGSESHPIFNIPVHEENREEFKSAVKSIIELYANTMSKFSHRRLLLSLMDLRDTYQNVDGNIEHYIERYLTIPIDSIYRSKNEVIFEMNIVRNNIPILTARVRTDMTTYSPTKLNYSFFVDYNGELYKQEIVKYMDSDHYQQVIHDVIDKSGLVY